MMARGWPLGADRPRPPEHDLHQRRQPHPSDIATSFATCAASSAPPWGTPGGGDPAAAR
jgi:hypothetical protein